MTDHYALEFELDTRPTADQAQAILSQLDGFRPALGTSATGTVSLTITVPADRLGLAVRQGVTLVERLVGIIGVSTLPETVRDAGQG